MQKCTSNIYYIKLQGLPRDGVLSEYTSTNITNVKDIDKEGYISVYIMCSRLKQGSECLVRTRELANLLCLVSKIQQSCCSNSIEPTSLET